MSALGAVNTLDDELSVIFLPFWFVFFKCQKYFRADQNLQFVQYYNIGWVREKVKLRYLYIEIFQESQVLTHKILTCYCCLSHTENFVFRAS